MKLNTIIILNDVNLEDRGHDLEAQFTNLFFLEHIVNNYKNYKRS